MASGERIVASESEEREPVVREKRQNEANCSWCKSLAYCDLARNKAESTRKTNPISGRRQGTWGERRVARRTLGANHASQVPERVAPSAPSRSDRFWLCELRVSLHFSTFYGSSVQNMDTQLGARHRRRTPTIYRGRAQRTISAGSWLRQGLLTSRAPA